MKLMQDLFASVLTCYVLLACLSVTSAFAKKRSGSYKDEDIVQINSHRKDKGVVYGIYHYNKTSVELEVRLEISESEKMNHSLYLREDWDIISYDAFGKASVLMTYIDTSTKDRIDLKFLIMDLANRKSYPVQSSDILFQDFGDIIWHYDYFEMVVRNKTVCSYQYAEGEMFSAEVCRVPFDKRGRKMAGNIAKFSAFIDGLDPIGEPWIPVSLHKSEEGFFHRSINSTTNKTVVSFVDSNGIEIKTFEDPDGLLSADSTANKYFTTCGMDYDEVHANMSVRCVQFDWGNRNISQNKTIGVHENAVSLSVINTGAGSFTIATSFVSNLTRAENVDAFEVIQIDGEGKEVNSKTYPLNLVCGGCSGGGFTSEIIQNGNELCFSHSCVHDSWEKFDFSFVDKCVKF
ncbi:hypothetical protein QAD02_009358 [Eretmocerus hayati]|uniref:Uncharacterized protein n=1 Tax=Eretmocerus hayati TaxID=131215 RepID=A0ACC2NDK6_9HYME|nr:hypothetical protein QAD02_009358 [Eretmocerus hayati]